MGWFSRKANVGTLKSDIKQASHLPLDQRMQLASEVGEFIEETKSVMQTPDHTSTAQWPPTKGRFMLTTTGARRTMKVVSNPPH